MAKIVKKYTYNIADDYLYQTNDLGKTAEWTYNGPDKIWVFVDKETLKLVNNVFYTEEENGANIPEPLDQIKVEIDCDKDPLLGSLFHADHLEGHIDYSTLPKYTETMPDGTVYSRPLHPTPDHTYELFDLEYDVIAGEFKKPYPWKKPHVTWDDIRLVRNRALDISDFKINSDMPASLKAEWEEYRQKMRDIPQTYAGKDPWKITFPETPEDIRKQ